VAGPHRLDRLDLILLLCLDHADFSGGRRSSRFPRTPNPFGIGIDEALDHKGITTPSVINGNR
jgi:hypothetical protein